MSFHYFIYIYINSQFVITIFLLLSFRFIILKSAIPIACSLLEIGLDEFTTKISALNSGVQQILYGYVKILCQLFIVVPVTFLKNYLLPFSSC